MMGRRPGLIFVSGSAQNRPVYVRLSSISEGKPAMAKGGAANPSAARGSAVGAAAKSTASGTRARKARARDLGIPLSGTPGPHNAITDVAGVEVGHATLIEGDGPLVVGKGPVRTGVTAILPRGKESLDPVFAGCAVLNGNGEMTGTAWVEESGFLSGPIMITNTHSVGVVRDAVVAWLALRNPGLTWALPVVAETFDGILNDINGFHVTKEHAFTALENASSGPVEEGNAGGGTAMICHEFKGGIGTASRVLRPSQGGHTVGVLCQCNHGRRRDLTIAGVAVGREIPELMPCYDADAPPKREWLRDALPRCGEAAKSETPTGRGSIIVVVATDAPVLPHQLKRLARRTALGLALVGGRGHNDSGDLMIAFSVANPGAADPAREARLTMLPNESIDGLFAATIEATEEAIVNAMLAAKTMTGADGVRIHAIPHHRLVEILKRYNRP
jgi:D-aminopeptidase